MSKTNKVSSPARILRLKARAAKMYVRIAGLAELDALGQKGLDALNAQLGEILGQLKALDPEFPKEYKSAWMKCEGETK